MQKQKLLIIMRGVQGSGKSFTAKYLQNLFNQHNIPINKFSADDFFYDEQGLYNFESQKLSSAHNKCLRNTINTFVNKQESVIVDNTNTILSDFNHYTVVAKAYGYRVVIVEVNAPIETLLLRQQHSCSKEVIEKFFARMKERLPKWIGELYQFDNTNDVEHQKNIEEFFQKELMNDA